MVLIQSNKFRFYPRFSSFTSCTKLKYMYNDSDELTQQDKWEWQFYKSL